MSQPRHRRRTQHVQHHLLRSPRLQPRRPRQHFRPHLWRNHNLRHPPHWHPQIRRHRHRHRPARTRVLQRPQHVRRRPARRNSHHHVLRRHSNPPQIPLSIPLRILRTFHRPRNRPPSSRNQRPHHLRRNSKRRRALRRIHHSHPPARPRPHINQPPPLSNPRHNCIHRPRNRPRLPPHSRRHFAVLPIHQPPNLQRAHPIELPRRRISLFRIPAFLGSRGHQGIIQTTKIPSSTGTPACAPSNKHKTIHRRRPLLLTPSLERPVRFQYAQPTKQLPLNRASLLAKNQLC